MKVKKLFVALCLCAVALVGCDNNHIEHVSSSAVSSNVLPSVIENYTEHMRLADSGLSSDFDDFLFLANYTGFVEIEGEGTYLVSQRVDANNNRIGLIAIDYIGTTLNRMSIKTMIIGYIENNETLGRYAELESAVPENIDTDVLKVEYTTIKRELATLTYEDMKYAVNYYYEKGKYHG